MGFDTAAAAAAPFAFTPLSLHDKQLMHVQGSATCNIPHTHAHTHRKDKQKQQFGYVLWSRRSPAEPRGVNFLWPHFHFL